MRGGDRRRVQLAVRIGALLFVLAWLFSSWLQGRVPYWLPFVALAFTELEFVGRGWWESRSGQTTEPAASSHERRLPGADDADLGWVDEIDEDGLVVRVPAPARERRRHGRWTALLGIVLAAALFAVALRVDRRDTWASLSPSERRAAEHRFSQEASTIAGKPVRIDCDEAYAFTGVGTDAAGVAFPHRALAYLEPSVCRSLRRVAFEGTAGPRAAAAWAITVLAHEAVHLRGVRSEGLTECYALQEGTALGRRLGLGEAEAAALMQAQLALSLSDRSIDRFAYRLPAGCEDGGELDLRPDDRSFP